MLNDCSGHSLDRFMSWPLGTISKRAWLEVSLEDRLQYELERTLHHPGAFAEGRGPNPATKDDTAALVETEVIVDPLQ
jgi:hypothetical protein